MASDTHIVHITDTTDKRAEIKLRSAYVLHGASLGLEKAAVDFVPATTTLEIGGFVSELLTNSQRPEQLILSVNCAPPAKKEGTSNNARNDFFCAELENNATVCGTSNGFEFSYIRPLIKQFYRLTNSNSQGAQFRSLEILPKHSLLFAQTKTRQQLIDDKTLAPANKDEVIRPLPGQSHVFEIDNFGNVKIWISDSDLKKLNAALDKKIAVQLGTASLETTAEPQNIGYSAAIEALIAPTLFAAPLGTNVLALKSSSTFCDKRPAPILATIREHPAYTQSSFALPPIGAPVKFLF